MREALQVAAKYPFVFCGNRNNCLDTKYTRNAVEFPLADYCKNYEGRRFSSGIF
jgi:hypothetical protein